MDFGGMTLRRKLILSFILIGLMPSIFFSSLYYLSSKSKIEEDNQQYIQNNALMLEVFLMEYFQQLNSNVNQIYHNDTFLDVISERDPSELGMDDYHLLNIEIYESVFRSYEDYFNGQVLGQPTLYLLDSDILSLFNFTPTVQGLGEIRAKEWYQTLSRQSPFDLVYEDLASGPVLHFVKKIYALKNKSLPFAGVVVVDVSIDYMSGYLERYKPTSGSNVYITDQDGLIILSSNRSLVGMRQEEQMYDEDDYVMVSHGFDDLGWQMINAIPRKELYEQIDRIRYVTNILIAAISLALIMVGMILGNSISKPIHMIVDSMKAKDMDSLDESLEYSYEDEFGYLVSHYNSMNLRIKELADRVTSVKVEKNRAELEALQTQIKPHFLYNTLDSINWLALSRGAEDVSHMITSLSDFFRYSLSGGKTIITLEDEFRQVESYMKVQAFRHPEIDYELACDGQYGDTAIVKLTLQPLIENAIVHGFKDKKKDARITVSCFALDGYIHVSVIDNGVGVDTVAMNELLDNSDRQTRGYGIINVQRRIRTHFGDDCGLNYISNEEMGTHVQVKLPRGGV